MEVDAKQRARSRNIILLIAAVFLLPMIIAWSVYYSVNDWGGHATQNHGHLVRPARPLSDFTLQREDGTKFDLNNLKHKWTLVYIGDKSCAQACAETLYKTRQSRLAQGKGMERIQRVFVLNHIKLTADERSVIHAAHPQLIILDGDDVQLKGFIQQFAIDGKDVAKAHRVYIVDPLGNLMMSYEPDFKGPDLIKDLERLLKVSQIG